MSWSPLAERSGRRNSGASAYTHMLFLDGVCVEHPDGALRFRWVRVPPSVEFTRPTQTAALRIGRYLERQGLLERDVENSYLAGDEVEFGPMKLARPGHGSRPSVLFWLQTKMIESV